MSDLITVQGVVLSAMPVGEYDKRIVLLTRERGKISAFAKGARRPNSQFLAAANPFVFGTFALYEGRSSYNLNPNIDDRLVRCIFELRMMAAQGLCPSLFHCVCCERQPVEGEELFFSQQNHGILDKACLGHVNDAKRISAPALYTMQYIVTASLGKLYTFTVTEEVLHELERHIHTYIAANTEKRFKSLEILEIMS